MDKIEVVKMKTAKGVPTEVVCDICGDVVLVKKVDYNNDFDSYRLLNSEMKIAGIGYYQDKLKQSRAAKIVCIKHLDMHN